VGSFDCAYCQFPKSKHPGTYYVDVLMPPEKLIKTIETCIQEKINNGSNFNSITVAGNGEPGIYPDLLLISRFLRKLIDDLKLCCKLSIFTNAAFYSNPDFTEALRLFDLRFIKLDASDEQTHHRINKPHVKVDLDDLAEALAFLDGVIIQTMVITGNVDNRPSVLSQKYAKLVMCAKAQEVQLYTINKKPAYEGILPVTKQDLDELKEQLDHVLQQAIPVNVYYQGFPSGL
jgi:wyosine [tRNA(Phe)-imidazoG37] synthetase (radical SAM superfamily)